MPRRGELEEYAGTEGDEHQERIMATIELPDLATGMGNGLPRAALSITMYGCISKAYGLEEAQEAGIPGGRGSACGCLSASE